MNRLLGASTIGALSLMATIGAVQLMPSASFAIQDRGARRQAGEGGPPNGLIAATPKATIAEARRGEVRKRAWEASVMLQEFIPASAVLDVVPDPDAEGADREWQLAVAVLIGQQAEEAQFVPEERIEHFAWIDSDRFPIMGWKGTILDMAELPEGLHVRMKVSPVFSGPCVTTDSTVETYKIAGDVVLPVAIEPGDPSTPRVFTCQ